MASDVRSVELRFKAETYAKLENLSRRTGKTIEEILGEAIGLELWLLEAPDRGEEVLVARGRRLYKVDPPAPSRLRSAN
jgi:hypothetical protein